MNIRRSVLSASAIAFFCVSSSAIAWTPQHIENKNSSSHVIQVSDQLESEALDFVRNLAHEGIGLLANSDLGTEKRQQEFRKLLKNKFDMKTIGRFALGRYWKTSTKEQQKEYLTLFEDMIVSVYSRRFGEYNGEALEVTSSRKEGKADVLVSSSIIPQSGPKISVDWRIRKKNGGDFKVVDIMVEGVSMSLTQRSDFASVIQRGGGNVDVLLAHLRQ